jgi:DNA-binding NtrC family response regulator
MVGRLEWSGNVRELQNVAQRVMILYDGETFSIEWRGCSAMLMRHPNSDLLLRRRCWIEKGI